MNIRDLSPLLQIILPLGHEGVYNHVSDGTDPTDFTELASHLPTPADPDAPTSGELKLIQDWLKDDAIAKDIICHQLSPAILQLVPQEQSSTAHDAQQLLHSHLNHIDLGSQYLVWEKILGLQMKDAKDAQHYLGEHDSLHWELIRMQVTYTDSEAIFNLLKGLPRTGTWPAFKLVLQTSISSSAAGISLSTSASASAATCSKGKLPASVVSAVPGSFISHLLSTAGSTTFESVSTHIAAEAHWQVLEATLLSPLGVEYAHAVSAPTQSGCGGVVNPAMGLQRCRAGWIATCTTVLCLQFDSPTLGPHFPIPRPIVLLLGCIASHQVVSHRVMSHHLVSGCITLCRVASPCVRLHHIVSGCITSCRVASPHVGLCHIGLGRVASCRVASHCVGLHWVASHRVRSRCIASGCIASCQVASCQVSHAIIRSHRAVINPIWCTIPPCYYSPSCTLSSCSFCEGLAFTYMPPYLASVTVTLGACLLL